MGQLDAMWPRLAQVALFESRDHAENWGMTNLLNDQIWQDFGGPYREHAAVYHITIWLLDLWLFEQIHSNDLIRTIGETTFADSFATGQAVARIEPWKQIRLWQSIG